MHTLEIKPIKAETLETHEEELLENLFKIQLIFADEKFKEEKINNPKLTFVDVLKRFTTIPSKFKKMEQCLNEIENIYHLNQGGWLEKITTFLISKTKELKNSESNNTSEDKRTKAGLFAYEFIKNDKENLAKHGFNASSEYVQIHFDEFYKTNDKKFGPDELKKSLEEIATIIVDKFPQAETVVGKSWLVDTGLAKRLGFEIIEKDDCYDHISTWWQFIDKNGQINKTKLQEFIYNKKLPHQVALGIIKIEDFLKRYLPPERRGRIVLKELKPGFIEKYKVFEEVTTEFKEKFDSLKEDELENFLRRSAILSEWLDSEDGNNFLKLIKQAKRSGVGIKKFLSDKKEELKSLERNIEYFKHKEYQDKEIII